MKLMTWAMTAVSNGSSLFPYYNLGPAVVITDGIDTSSKLTPAQVSGIASAIDVPVYVIAVLSPLDHPGMDSAVVGADASPVATHLSNLSYWTGGTLFMVSVFTFGTRRQ